MLPKQAVTTPAARNAGGAAESTFPPPGRQPGCRTCHGHYDNILQIDFYLANFSDFLIFNTSDVTDVMIIDRRSRKCSVPVCRQAEW